MSNSNWAESWALNPASPCVLILAAGRGERFRASGGSTHKLDAILGDQVVLQHSLAAVKASGLDWHIERGPHHGMGNSIAAAVRARPDAAGWLILPADLPLVLPSTLRAVADVIQQAEANSLLVVQPQFSGQRGHPVGFSKAAGPALLALHGDKGASNVVRSAAEHGQLRLLDTDDEGVVLDVDTVEALERAKNLWSRRKKG